MSASLFHLAPPRDWAAFEREGRDELRPASLASEGFVHLSRADQLAGTLATHFGGWDELVLVELVPEALGDALRWEPSRGGALFPHLHRALRRSDVARAVPLRRRAGVWELPGDL